MAFLNTRLYASRKDWPLRLWQDCNIRANRDRTVESSKALVGCSSNWFEITNSSSFVENNILGYWDTTTVDDGLYFIKLEVKCQDGLYEDLTSIAVNNEVNTFIVDDDGGEDFTEIQQALKNSGDGDTIYVKNGKYSCDSSITIDRSISLIGESKENTIINAGFFINVDNVHLERINIRSSHDFGIYLEFINI